jgi:hypothetical protein
MKSFTVSTLRAEKVIRRLCKTGRGFKLEMIHLGERQVPTCYPKSFVMHDIAWRFEIAPPDGSGE